jgi:hypothetical protein
MRAAARFRFVQTIYIDIITGRSVRRFGLYCSRKHLYRANFKFLSPHNLAQKIYRCAPPKNSNAPKWAANSQSLLDDLRSRYTYIREFELLWRELKGIWWFLFRLWYDINGISFGCCAASVAVITQWARAIVCRRHETNNGRKLFLFRVLVLMRWQPLYRLEWDAAWNTWVVHAFLQPLSPFIIIGLKESTRLMIYMKH